MKDLLQAGANPTLASVEGQTPLHTAAQVRHIAALISFVPSSCLSLMCTSGTWNWSRRSAQPNLFVLGSDWTLFGVRLDLVSLGLVRNICRWTNAYQHWLSHMRASSPFQWGHAREVKTLIAAGAKINARCQKG